LLAYQRVKDDDQAIILHNVSDNPVQMGEDLTALLAGFQLVYSQPHQAGDGGLLPHGTWVFTD
jgi:hypothetical protein